MLLLLFFTWDLESGYHYVDIFCGHQRFLVFLALKRYRIDPRSCDFHVFTAIIHHLKDLFMQISA